MNRGIRLRSLEPGELGAYWDTVAAAFGWEEPAEDMGAWLAALLDPGRTVGAFDGNVLAGVGAAYRFRMTVPGGEVPAAGVTLVGVLPTHRRRGILTGMMRRLLDDAAAAEEPVAYLWASEDAIYGRFGFGMAALLADLDAERDRTVLLDRSPPAGRLRMLSTAEALDVVPALYEEHRRTTPGAFARTRTWWERHTLRDPPPERGGAGPLRTAVWELDGAARGYAVWRVRSSWDGGVPAGSVVVREAVGLDAVATREVWRFLLGIDLVRRVTAEHLPVDHPLAHMVTEPRRLGLRLTWPLWLRIVDVPSALAARAYGADGRLVLELDDSFRPANAGRWLLEVSSGAGRCARTEEEPDVRCSVAELGAAYLGSTSVVALAAAGRVKGCTAGAVERADAFFGWPRAAWCPEIF